jgi:DNA-binding MarR family transcriptional regulator
MGSINYKGDLNINEKIMMAIVRVAERFKKESSLIFRSYGITFSQYNVLRVLDASENGQNTMTNVSRIMLSSGANLTGIVKRLEAKGFLTRKKDPLDARTRLLKITPKGQRTLKEIFDKKERQISGYLTQYSDDEKAFIFTKLKRILRKDL